MSRSERDLSQFTTERTHAPEPHLAQLGEKFQAALVFRQKGDDTQAEPILRAILAVEPRLAEPRLELAHIAIGRGDWAEAEDQALEALERLRAGGQWIDTLPPGELLSFAANLLGEVLVREIEDGDLLLEDPVGFRRTWNEAAKLFREAVRSDPSNADALRNATRYVPTEEPAEG